MINKNKQVSIFVHLGCNADKSRMYILPKELQEMVHMAKVAFLYS